jgi:ribonuclease E
MPTKRMLIDATHPEETRVVVLNGNRIENFDVEVDSRRQLKGNIYLAKVTRVEPSLQAAFIEYGGNRHGFLAFNEIHPDYYQIPVADREALLAEQAAEKIEVEPEDDDVPNEEASPEPVAEEAEGGESPEQSEESATVETTPDAAPNEGSDVADTSNDDDIVGGVEEIATSEDTPENLETLAGEDEAEEPVRRPSPSRRNYKIQEVIKRRQILLVQVVKEERGNKGAALTTYISLAGRYCVLMPNTARGGGISRKITNGTDRKRLKTIVNSLGIPEGMAVIMRTAGTKQTKPQIKRDYDYLLRLWSTVRELTLESIAPCLVYEEGNLIKRSIRDLYSKDIDEIVVEGDASYRMAKDFMKMFIPSHAKRVQPYSDSIMPLMHRFQVEGQLDAMHSPEVQLKSGGYIVINPTEALVAIDVNSGRSTKERNIEETAYKTNLEAAEEIALQLRLRDLAGLIVIDFIDMEINRNNAQVERKLKDCMREDRARIQIGRISGFGLLELSRQRLRPSIIESTSEVCPHCEGTGIRRSTESTALNILRAIEEEGTRKRLGAITVFVPTAVALYILNQKRQMLADIEARYEFAVTLEADEALIPPNHRIERTESGIARPEAKAKKAPQQPVEQADNAQSGDQSPTDGEEAPRKRRRRGRRRRKSSQNAGAETPNVASETTATTDESGGENTSEATPVAASGTEEGEEAPKRRRRGRRGGRKRRPANETVNNETANNETVTNETVTNETGNMPVEASNESPAPDGNGAAADIAATAPAEEAPKESATSDEEVAEKKPRRRRRRSPKKSEESPDNKTVDVAADAGETKTESPKADVPVAVVSDVKEPAPASGGASAGTNIVNVGGNPAEGSEEDAPRRRGWWQRLTE